MNDNTNFMKSIQKGDRVRVVHYTRGEAGHASVHVVTRRTPAVASRPRGARSPVRATRRTSTRTGASARTTTAATFAASSARSTTCGVTSSPRRRRPLRPNCRAVAALQEKLAAALVAQKTAEDMLLAAQKAERGEK